MPRRLQKLQNFPEKHLTAASEAHIILSQSCHADLDTQAVGGSRADRRNQGGGGGQKCVNPWNVF